MTTKIIRDWLSQYKTLKPAEIHEYADKVKGQRDVLDALTLMFEGDLSNENVAPVCHQLFNFYKSSVTPLAEFTLELIPVILEVYLQSISKGDKMKCGAVEALLLGIYNMEITMSDGKPKISVLHIPTIGTPSVYHEPPSLASMALTETALLRHDRSEAITVQCGPFPAYSTLVAQNRHSVLSYVLRVYYDAIASLSPSSRVRLVRAASRLCKQGFTVLLNQKSCQSTKSPSVLRDGEKCDPSSSDNLHVQANFSWIDGVQRQRLSSYFSSSEVRIPLSAGLMLELLSCAYFDMFNGHARQGLEAIEQIHRRATFEMYHDVLLVTNAIQNSLNLLPSGQPGALAMGVSVSVTPTQPASLNLKRAAITNASFRAKRLPEDIEIIEEENQASLEDVVESDRSASSASVQQPPASTAKAPKSHLANPLKSLMKSKSSDKQPASAEPAKSKTHVKESGRLSGENTVPHLTTTASIVPSDVVVNPSAIHVEMLPMRSDDVTVTSTSGSVSPSSARRPQTKRGTEKKETVANVQDSDTENTNL